MGEENKPFDRAQGGPFDTAPASAEASAGRQGGPAFSPISELYRRVDEVLDRIRPYVQMDGGHVELVNVNEEDGIVYIRFQGSCQGCPSSAMTLQMGIENEIKTSLPEIKQVVAV